MEFSASGFAPHFFSSADRHGTISGFRPAARFAITPRCAVGLPVRPALSRSGPRWKSYLAPSSSSPSSSPGRCSRPGPGVLRRRHQAGRRPPPRPGGRGLPHGPRDSLEGGAGDRRPAQHTWVTLPDVRMTRSAQFKSTLLVCLARKAAAPRRPRRLPRRGGGLRGHRHHLRVRRRHAAGAVLPGRRGGPGRRRAPPRCSSAF